MMNLRVAARSVPYAVLAIKVIRKYCKRWWEKKTALGKENIFCSLIA
jgi:hypothetical protein